MRLLATAFVLLALAPGAGAVGPPLPPRLTPASHDDAWALLPQERPALPAWARLLVRSLPKTTGFMLELDALHRARNPLGPALAARLRWAAADALGCNYAKKYAEADLRRAKVKDQEIEALARDTSKLMAFARKMSLAAHTVTDEEVAELLEQHGPEKLVAIVHTLAHANFQCRIFLTLRVTVEPGGPLPPLEARLDRAARMKLATPPRQWAGLKGVKAPEQDARPDWQERAFADVQKAVAVQKERKPRIPLPEAKRLAKLPPDMRQAATRITWSHVSMGYQPQLTRAWFETMGCFQSEARFDRLFSNTYFWVVTRSNECFY